MNDISVPKLSFEPMTFEFDGRSISSGSDENQNSDIFSENSSRYKDEYLAKAKSIEIDVLSGLKISENEIENEIVQGLLKQFPESAFSVEISFHKGSIEWAGIVKILASNEILQAAANVGGAIGIGQIIAKTISTIIGGKLPPVYSAPITKCKLLGVNSSLVNFDQLKIIKNSLTELIIAIINYFFVQLKHIIRKISHLPYIINGVNPYAFSKNGEISQSNYSKISIRLFGWASLSVVGYITIASQKIFKEFNLFGDSGSITYILSIFVGIIVFIADRFILSYPKKFYNVDSLIRKLKISSAPDHKKNKLIIWDFLNDFISFSWFGTLILTVIRFVLALTISGLLILTMIISGNKISIDNQISNSRKTTAVQSINKTSEYSNYISALLDVRRSYFDAQANKLCLPVAARGINKSDKGIIEATESTMSGAPIAAFGITGLPLPPSFDCGIKDSRACLSANNTCPEYGRVVKNQSGLDAKYANNLTLYNSANSTLLAIYKEQLDQLKANGADISIKLQALAELYKEKEKNGTLIYELLSASPFLLILLMFELIPAIAKIFFKPTAFDYLMAKENLFHQLNATIPKSAEVKHLIAYHFENALNATSLAELKALDELEKTKNEEVKNAMEDVFEKSIQFFENFASVISLPVATIFAFLLLLLFFISIYLNLSWIKDLFNNFLEWKNIFTNLK